VVIEISKTASIVNLTFRDKFERYRLDDSSILDANLFRALDDARTTEVTGLLRIVAPCPVSHGRHQFTLSLLLVFGKRYVDLIIK
jgi:hypothetical protein